MILVTGGTGFIGGMLVRNLLKKGEKVAVLCRDSGKARRMFPKAKVIHGDVTDRKTLSFGKVDKVVHLAGMVSYSKTKEELFKVNVDGTRNILDACKGAKRFVLASSVGAIGPVKGVTTELTPCRPVTPYGESKLEAEGLVRDSGLPNVILRFAPVFGERSPYWLKNLKLLEKGFPIPNVKTMTHVLHSSNAARALELALGKGSGTYLIADRTPVRFVDFASSIIRLLGNEPKVMPASVVSMMAALGGKGSYLKVLTMNRQYDITKAKKELGYEPKGDFKKELEGMVDWYKKEKDKNTVKEGD
jgi:nucleoside-diphosphate-sugar epimerase